MSHKLIFTKVDNQPMAALFEDDVCMELQRVEESDKFCVGKIFVGRVKNIVTNIQAAFIEIQPDMPCYYGIPKEAAPLRLKHGNNEKLCIGDELLVQVSKEAVKTKVPSVTTNLQFGGKYFIVTTEDDRVGISNKIQGSDRQRLQIFVQQYKNLKYGVVVRTNAKDASEEELKKELDFLIETCENVLEKAKYQKCFSCVYEPVSGYSKIVQNTYREHLTDILTDDYSVYETLMEYFRRFEHSELGKLRYYDEQFPLVKLLSLEEELKAALKDKVWLKSGAYLKIQPTEALTAIDVNTGKYTSKKQDEQETFLKINIEAAKEIARQIRLRNLSGIIIIDFIDMKSEKAKECLMGKLRELLSHDPLQAVVVDMTALNLVEVTRKKVKKPLFDQWLSYQRFEL